MIARTSVMAPLVGHVGDGNLRLILFHDPADASETGEAQAIDAALLAMPIQIAGHCTGERGVGLGEKHHMDVEHGSAFGVMRRIRRALDSTNILTPGKIFDP